MLPRSTRRLDFSDHRRELGANRYVYAVVSRRARGLSIGINLNPDKVCNFDCPYCQVDRTVPGGDKAIDLEVLRAELGVLLDHVREGTLWEFSPFDTAAPELRRVVDIAFAGDGEPTSPKAFPAVAEAVAAMKAEYGLVAPIRLLTNATLLHRASVRAGLAFIDEPWCKLDAGTVPYFRVVDGTTYPFARILRNLRELAAERPIIIQSMWMAMDGVGPSDAETDAWAERLGEIGNIGLVQVYTVARRPAQPSVTPLPRESLDAIAVKAAAIGLKTEVYA